MAGAIYPTLCCQGCGKRHRLGYPLPPREDGYRYTCPACLVEPDEPLPFMPRLFPLRAGGNPLPGARMTRTQLEYDGGGDAGDVRD